MSLLRKEDNEEAVGDSKPGEPEVPQNVERGKRVAAEVNTTATAGQLGPNQCLEMSLTSERLLLFILLADLTPKTSKCISGSSWLSP